MNAGAFTETGNPGEETRLGTYLGVLITGVETINSACLVSLRGLSFPSFKPSQLFIGFSSCVDITDQIAQY